MTTETYRSSGVDGGWGPRVVASTHSSRLYKLKEDGSTVEFTSRRGLVSTIRAIGDRGTIVRMVWSGWLGKMWVAIKPALRLYLVDPETMEVERSIPTPGAAPHG